MSINHARSHVLTLIGPFLLGPLLVTSAASAGDHKKGLVPVYVQQAPAPAPSYFLAPAPAPLVYSAPLTYSTPAPMTYSAPTAGYGAAPAAGYGAIRSAPGGVVGSRLTEEDRQDVFADLKTEYKDVDKSDKRRDRRKTLRESATTKYGEILGDDAESVNASEKQEIEAMVSAIMNHQALANGNAPTPYNQSAPYPTPYPYPYPNQAPFAGTIQYFQPVVPVQFLVPIQPKHHKLHHH